MSKQTNLLSFPHSLLQFCISELISAHLWPRVRRVQHSSSFSSHVAHSSLVLVSLWPHQATRVRRWVGWRDEGLMCVPDCALCSTSEPEQRRSVPQRAHAEHDDDDGDKSAVKSDRETGPDRIVTKMRSMRPCLPDSWVQGLMPRG